MRTAEQALDVSLAPRRFNVVLLAAFAVAGLALAGAGLYAVVSDAVAQRRRELAVRMAMGAERRDIVRLVLADVAKLVTAGIAIGAALAIVLARSLATSLFGVGSADPLTWVVVPLVLAGGRAGRRVGCRRVAPAAPIHWTDSGKPSRRATSSALSFRVEPEGESVGWEEVKGAGRPYLPSGSISRRVASERRRPC